MLILPQNLDLKAFAALLEAAADIMLLADWRLGVVGSDGKLSLLSSSSPRAGEFGTEE